MSACLARLIAAGEEEYQEVLVSKGERMGLASCWPSDCSLPSDLRSKAPKPSSTRNGPTTAYLNFRSRSDHTSTEPQGAVGEGARRSGSDRLGIHFLLNPQTVLEDGRDHHLHDEEGDGQPRTATTDRSENRALHPRGMQDEEELLSSRSTWTRPSSSDREENFTLHHRPSASAAKRHSSKPSGRRSRGNGSPWTTETRKDGAMTLHDGDEEEGAEEEGRALDRRESLSAGNEAMRRSLNEKLKRRLDEKRMREAEAQARPVPMKKTPVGLVATKKELDIWEKLMLTSVIQPYLPSRSSPGWPQRRASRVDHRHQAREAPPLRVMPSLSSSFQLLSRLGAPSATSSPSASPQIPEMIFPIARSAVGAIQPLGQHAQVVDLTTPSLPQQAMRSRHSESRLPGPHPSSTPTTVTERKRKRQENDEEAVHQQMARRHQHPSQAGTQGMLRLVFHQVDFTPSHLSTSRGSSKRVPRSSGEDHRQQHNQIACDGFMLPPPAHAACRASGRA